MPKVKLELQKQTILERISFGKQFTGKMTGNVNFPNLAAETEGRAKPPARLKAPITMPMRRCKRTNKS